MPVEYPKVEDVIGVTAQDIVFTSAVNDTIVTSVMGHTYVLTEPKHEMLKTMSYSPRLSPTSGQPLESDMIRRHHEVVKQVHSGKIKLPKTPLKTREQVNEDSLNDVGEGEFIGGDDD